jgi:hypothetical protein
VGNGLRGYLTQTIRYEIFERKSLLDIRREMELCKAGYMVRIYPALKDRGLRPINVGGRGLCKTISKAEGDFKKVNGAGGIGRRYVWIMLGDKRYRIPKKIWKPYTE